NGKANIVLGDGTITLGAANSNAGAEGLITLAVGAKIGVFTAGEINGTTTTDTIGTAVVAGSGTLPGTSGTLTATDNVVTIGGPASGTTAATVAADSELVET
ncbi:MAG: hypothetical protein LBD13_07590, partial [Spirochaetaceae bacterium]|nr:hypothetical protein [Spirochaetaceae bacterium]